MVWVILGLIGLIVTGLMGGGLWLMLRLNSLKKQEDRPGPETERLALPNLVPGRPTLTGPYPARPDTVSFPLTRLQAGILLSFGPLAAGFAQVLMRACLQGRTFPFFMR